MADVPSPAARAPEPGPTPLAAPDRPLRILFSSYRSHPHVGGQGVYAREVTRALVELGHEVDVVSGPPYPELDPRVGLVRLPSLDLFTVENALAAFRWRFLRDRADLAEWWLHNTGAFGEPYAFGHRLARWAGRRLGDYDVIHDNQGLSGGLLALRARGAAVTATLHHPITIDLAYALAGEPDALKRALIGRWHSFLATQARVARALPVLLTVSEASAEAAARDFGVARDRLVVAPNGVDHYVFRVQPEIAREPGLVLAAVSADTPLKGLAVLAEAFARLAARRPQAKLLIIGTLREGPAKRILGAAGLGGRVETREGLSHADIAKLYARCAVFVAASLFEGFGMPTAEAMACGAAVAASDGGALPEVVGEAGVITAAGDAGALAAALEALLDDEPRRLKLGIMAAQRARLRFHWRAHALAALGVYGRAGAAGADH